MVSQFVSQCFHGGVALVYVMHVLLRKRGSGFLVLLSQHVMKTGNPIRLLGLRDPNVHYI